MDRAKLEKILDMLPYVRVAVVGDFFLDRYFVIESELAEISVETGLTAHQVVDKRLSPGAAGNVVANLRALGVGDVVCVGVIGADGEGFELKKCLHSMGANYAGWLIERSDRFTPCYSKPMLRENGKETELNRIDIKNRSPLPTEAEDELLERLGALVVDVDAVIIADQVQERNFGVVTDRVRASISDLAERHSDKVFLVDSRLRVGEYRNVMTKPNKFEVVHAITDNARADASADLEVSLDEAKACARKLYERTSSPVFLTAQEEGIFVFDNDVTHVPAAAVSGEIDPVGAGDSCAAGIVSALCGGADLAEAALVGNIAASVTIKKIGRTGTASPKEVLERFDENSKEGRAE